MAGPLCVPLESELAVKSTTPAAYRVIETPFGDRDVASATSHKLASLYTYMPADQVKSAVYRIAIYGRGEIRFTSAHKMNRGVLTYYGGTGHRQPSLDLGQRCKDKLNENEPTPMPL